MLGIIKKIIGKLDYLSRKISLYQWKSGDGEENSLYIYEELLNSSSIDSLKFAYDKAEYTKRLSLGHVFCGLKNSTGVLLSYGWLNESNQHYLGELDLWMNIPSNHSVLYDFNTFEEFRGRGLYPYLLQCICARDTKSKLIYAFPENRSSCKGILKANFKFLGTLSGFNKNNYSKLIQKS